MTPEEARTLLSAARPPVTGEGDPLLAEALRLVEQDPALRAWWQAEQAFDVEMAKRLREVTPPADLRAALLAGRPLRRPKRNFVPVWSWAAAACLLLTLGGTWGWPHWRTAQFSRELAAFATQDLSTGAHGGEGAVVSHWQQVLGTTPSLVAASAKLDFAELRAKGCRQFTFDGKRGIEICFSRPEGEFHLYVVQWEGARDQPVRLQSLDGATATSWLSQGLVFAVVGDKSESAQSFLRSLVR